MKKLLLVASALMLAAALFAGARAESIETKIPREYVAYCEEIGGMYGISPEFIEAVIEKESGGNPNVGNSYGCYGLMGVSKKWNADRMKRLGVTDLYDPYSNILVGTDLLYELFEKYEDPYVVLNYYGGWNYSERGDKYIFELLERSWQLEVVHEKIGAKG